MSSDNELSSADRLSGPVHEWFELSYAAYLTIPRSVLQSMPVEWQQRFTTCLRELDTALPWRPRSGRYWVTLKTSDGRFVSDPLNEYRRVPVLSAQDVDRLREGFGRTPIRSVRHEAKEPQ